MPLRRLIAPLLLLAAALACGGGGSTSWGGASTGTLTVRFGTDSFPGYDQAVVSMEKLEGSTNNGTSWTPLGTVQASYDLMNLQNGGSVKILPATSVPAGTYTQFRITWATVNYLDGARPAAYAYPSGASSGQIITMPTTTLIPGSVTVPVGGSATAQIMLSGQQAVQARAGTPSYTFQATGQAYDLAQVASLAGKLADSSGPLGHVEVYAETLDGTLTVPTIQRRTFTDASGNYLLEALPAISNTAYYVVAQPGNPSSAYAAEAADPVIVTSAHVYTANLVFSGPTTPGSLTLTITPPSTATQGTWGELRQNLNAGTSGPAILIVRSQTVASGISQDLAGFEGLAPGYYGVVAQRSTSGGVPVMKPGNQVQMVSGGIVTTSISY